MTDLVRAELGGLTVWLAPNLAECGVPHAFTTRRGGTSRGAFASLNLGLTTGDEEASVAANRRVVAAALGHAAEELRLVRQVHGGRLVSAAEAIPDTTEADGLLHDEPGLLLGVQVADCMPVLLASPDGGVVAAVHAGWRGLVAGILGHAVGALVARAAVDARLLRAAVGPAIGEDRYEVGPDVARQFSLEHRSAGRDDRWHLDLPGCAAGQLRSVGVVDIAVARCCTYDRAEEFFSHRRDGPRTGRQGGFIASRGR